MKEEVYMSFNQFNLTNTSGTDPTDDPSYYDPTNPASPYYDPTLVEGSAASVAGKVSVKKGDTTDTDPTSNQAILKAEVQDEVKKLGRGRRRMKNALIVPPCQVVEEIQQSKTSKKSSTDKVT